MASDPGLMRRIWRPAKSRCSSGAAKFATALAFGAATIAAFRRLLARRSKPHSRSQNSWRARRVYFRPFSLRHLAVLRLRSLPLPDGRPAIRV